MNILITGANGQLGEEIRRAVNKIGNGKPNHFVGDPNYYIFAGHNDLDITDEKETEKFIKDNFISVIVNCAAYTNVDNAQEDRDAAYGANSIGPLNLANAAKNVGAVLIHISTDYVFGGKYSTPIPPMSQMEPGFVPVERDKCYYGFSKLVGEDLVEHSGCKYIIVRTSWVYSSHHKNFVSTMYTFSLMNRPVRVVNDQVGSPTSAKELAKFIVHIIEDNNADTRYLSKQGIYNFAGKGSASWYELAKCVYNYDWLVTPCASNEYPTSVERPKYSVLDVSLIEKEFDYEIPVWTESLVEVLDELGALEAKRQEALEAENSEYEYGHNVCIKEKEES